MLASKVTDEYLMRGLKAGADGYIFKPFKWETLYESIKSVIGFTSALIAAAYYLLAGRDPPRILHRKDAHYALTDRFRGA
jgi:DNA-binding NarL/FixJ family response regulator